MARLSAAQERMLRRLSERHAFWDTIDARTWNPLFKLGMVTTYDPPMGDRQCHITHVGIEALAAQADVNRDKAGE